MRVTVVGSPIAAVTISQMLGWWIKDPLVSGAEPCLVVAHSSVWRDNFALTDR